MAIKVNDYVVFGDKKSYGKVKAISGQTVTIVDSSGNDQTAQLNTVEQSSMARIVIKAMPNMREAAENVIAMSAYNSFVGKRSLTSVENTSFLIASLVHEFFLKGFAASYFDILGDVTLDKKEDREAFFQSADFTEPVKRLPFIFGLTQLVQKLVFKKPLNHGAMHNLLGGYASMAVTNFADRKFFQGEDVYSYP